MRAEKNEMGSRNREEVTLAISDANEQMRRVQAAVARRAYAIFESRGSGSWHELEDWRQAQSELVRPLCCDQMTVGGASGSG
jgi:hypothetical protein